MAAASGRAERNLPRLLGRVEGRRFSGVVYRVIGTRFLQSPLTSAGSALHGGRFNPPRSFEVLYTALAADTALAEREGVLLTAPGIKLARVRTSVLLRIDCRLERILDLTDEQVRQDLQIPLADLLSPWLPWNAASDAANDVPAPSQRIGACVHGSRRFEAILSAAAKDPRGRCLAIFPDCLGSESRITIDDPEGIICGALGMDRPV